jgi:predicted nucleic acid-binding protein
MGIERVSAVADAGPLIHLAEIDGLSLLSVFENLCLPEAVCLEVFKDDRISQSDAFGLGIVRQYTLDQQELAQFIKANNLEELHFGERESLSLCKHLAIQVLLTDDLAVREVARRLNLTPVGSLGVVVRAYRAGQISLAEAERDLMSLYEASSLFVTRTIVELAIAQLQRRV